MADFRAELQSAKNIRKTISYDGLMYIYGLWKHHIFILGKKSHLITNETFEQKQSRCNNVHLFRNGGTYLDCGFQKGKDFENTTPVMHWCAFFGWTSKRHKQSKFKSDNAMMCLRRLYNYTRLGVLKRSLKKYLILEKWEGIQMWTHWKGYIILYVVRQSSLKWSISNWTLKD